MDILTLALFCLLLLFSISFGISLIAALLGGLVLFAAYALYRGHSLKAVAGMALSGIKTVKNILITFLIIGALTALWRAAGTIPAIICYASGLIHPSVFILLTFVLNAAVSTLTGTSFGTAATMGVICASIANTMGVSIFWTGGAILAGAFYGDRCSPVSTSALLVSTVTGTDLYSNIRSMYRSALVPTVLSAAVFAIAGFAGKGCGGSADVYGLFGGSFVISPVALIPAAVVLVLAFFRVKVKKMLLISNVLAFIIALFLQKTPLTELVKYAVLGYTSADESLAPLINGGGILSMVRVGCIVCIASSYSGIFDGTGLLDSVKLAVRKISAKTCPFAAILLASAASGAVSCNQTLSIMLTNQICEGLTSSKEEMALCLEDTAVVTAALIPWSIAGTVVLTTAGVPLVCIAAAVYLYVLPLYRCGEEMLKAGRKKTDCGKRVC